MAIRRVAQVSDSAMIRTHCYHWGTLTSGTCFLSMQTPGVTMNVCEGLAAGSVAGWLHAQEQDLRLPGVGWSEGG